MFNMFNIVLFEINFREREKKKKRKREKPKGNRKSYIMYT